MSSKSDNFYSQLSIYSNKSIDELKDYVMDEFHTEKVYNLCVNKYNKLVGSKKTDIGRCPAPTVEELARLTVGKKNTMYLFLTVSEDIPFVAVYDGEIKIDGADKIKVMAYYHRTLN